MTNNIHTLPTGLLVLFPEGVEDTTIKDGNLWYNAPTMDKDYISGYRADFIKLPTEHQYVSLGIASTLSEDDSKRVAEDEPYPIEWAYKDHENDEGWCYTAHESLLSQLRTLGWNPDITAVLLKNKI